MPTTKVTVHIHHHYPSPDADAKTRADITTLQEGFKTMSAQTKQLVAVSKEFTGAVNAMQDQLQTIFDRFEQRIAAKAEEDAEISEALDELRTGVADIKSTPLPTFEDTTPSPEIDEPAPVVPAPVVNDPNSVDTL